MLPKRYHGGTVKTHFHGFWMARILFEDMRLIFLRTLGRLTRRFSQFDPVPLPVHPPDRCRSLLPPFYLHYFYVPS